MVIQLPDKTNAGSGLAVFHGGGLVVNGHTLIGQNVTLRQNTTIGHKRENEGVLVSETKSMLVPLPLVIM